MTDGQQEERDKREDEIRREERERRSEELRESWRRNHPSENEVGKDRPKKGRPA